MAEGEFEDAGQSDSERTAIARRFSLTNQQLRRCERMIRPMVLQQLMALLETPDGPVTVLRLLANPAVRSAASGHHEQGDQTARHEGEAIYQSFAKPTVRDWPTHERIALDAGVSRSTVRALIPLIAVNTLAAIRTAATPAALRYLLQHQPDNIGSDPFAFAAERARQQPVASNAPQATAPESALKWLDTVLARAEADDDLSLSYIPRLDERI